MTKHEHDHSPALHETPDVWHSHTPDEGLPQHEHAAHVNYVGLLVGFVGVVAVTVGLIVAVLLYYYHYTTRAISVNVETTAVGADARAYKASALADLQGYAWVDSTAGVVRIPIDQAMTEVVEQYQGIQGGAASAE